jgi:hypothetical protein
VINLSCQIWYRWMRITLLLLGTTELMLSFWRGFCVVATMFLHCCRLPSPSCAPICGSLPPSMQSVDCRHCPGLPPCPHRPPHSPRHMLSIRRRWFRGECARGSLSDVILCDLVARRNYEECVYMTISVATVQKSAILILWLQKICNSCSGDPKLRVNIAINTNIHMCTKNLLNLRRFRVLKAKP